MKKGFTLIELLAVIVILAVIALIAVPRITGAIEESRIGASRQNNEAVIKAAKSYLAINEENLPSVVGESYEISIEEIIESGDLKGLTNPFGAESCSGYVLVTYIGSEYEYVPNLKCNDVDNSLADGLVARFTFNNEIEGFTYSSVGDIQGELIGVSQADGRNAFSNGLSFSNTVNTYLDLGNSDDLNFYDENAFTFAMWIKPNNPTNSSATFIRRSFNGSVSNQASYHFGYEHSVNPARLRLRIHESNLISNADVGNNEWTHVAATFDGDSGVKRIFINGVLDAEQTTSRNVRESNERTTIGVRHFGDSYTYQYFGLMDDVMLYNRALSEEEIKEIYNFNR